MHAKAPLASIGRVIWRDCELGAAVAVAVHIVSEQLIYTHTCFAYLKYLIAYGCNQVDGKHVNHEHHQNHIH